MGYWVGAGASSGAAAAILGNVAYDPSTAEQINGTPLSVMAAISTTNLRITFTAPSSGSVRVHIRCVVSGTSTPPCLLLGVMEGSTVKGRVTPFATAAPNPNTGDSCVQDADFVVTGLTPGNSYIWDAAYSVDVLNASGGIKLGGPDNATVTNAWGQFAYEIWDANALLAGKLYDPAAAVSKALTAGLAMTAIDTTNLRNAFTAPSSGRVRWRLALAAHGAAGYSVPLLGVMSGASVVARAAPLQSFAGTWDTNRRWVHIGEGVISGLTPGNSYTYDAAYGVETLLASLNFKYGGPDDTTTNNAFGGAAFEIWQA